MVVTQKQGLICCFNLITFLVFTELEVRGITMHKPQPSLLGARVAFPFVLHVDLIKPDLVH